MTRRKRSKYSPEFKAEVVRLVLDEGRQASVVARELGVAPSRISGWVQQARADRGQGEEGALTTTEKEELARLRREVKQLQMEREILKKATAFFAKEKE